LWVEVDGNLQFLNGLISITNNLINFFYDNKSGTIPITARQLPVDAYTGKSVTINFNVYKNPKVDILKNENKT